MPLLNEWYLYRSQVSSSFSTNIDKINFGKPVLCILAGTQEKVKNQTGKEWCPQNFKCEKLYWTFLIHQQCWKRNPNLVSGFQEINSTIYALVFLSVLVSIVHSHSPFFEHGLSLTRNDNSFVHSWFTQKQGFAVAAI